MSIDTILTWMTREDVSGRENCSLISASVADGQTSLWVIAQLSPEYTLKKKIFCKKALNHVNVSNLSQSQGFTWNCLGYHQTWLADGAKRQNLPSSVDLPPKTDRTCRCKAPTTAGCALLPASASSPSHWFSADPIPSGRTWILIRLPPWRDIPKGLLRGIPKSGLWLAKEAGRSGTPPESYSPACQREVLLGGATWKEGY